MPEELDKEAEDVLADEPNMRYSGTGVNIIISGTEICMVAAKTNKVLTKHDLKKISFAYGGDKVSILSFNVMWLLYELKFTICFMLQPYFI